MDYFFEFNVVILLISIQYFQNCRKLDTEYSMRFTDSP